MATRPADCTIGKLPNGQEIRLSKEAIQDMMAFLGREVAIEGLRDLVKSQGGTYIPPELD